MSVPSAFPVPFQCLFQCLFTVCVRETQFCWQGLEKVQKALEKALERDWEQTRHMATIRTVAGTARHQLKTTHACASVGLRSPSTPNTADGETFKPFQPHGPLLPQSSMLEVLQECFGEWTKQIKPWKHKFNLVMFNIDLWGSGVGDSY